MGVLTLQKMAQIQHSKPVTNFYFSDLLKIQGEAEINSPAS